MQHNVALLSKPILFIPRGVALVHNHACIFAKIVDQSTYVFIKLLYNTTTKAGRYFDSFMYDDVLNRDYRVERRILSADSLKYIIVMFDN